jgi:hypothetical protein
MWDIKGELVPFEGHRLPGWVEIPRDRASGRCGPVSNRASGESGETMCVSAKALSEERMIPMVNQSGSGQRRGLYASQLDRVDSAQTILPGRVAVPDPGRRCSPRPIFVVADRLVQIWLSNEQALNELPSLLRRRDSVRSYLSSPGCNPELGRTCLNRIEKSVQELRARLHANDLEVRELDACLDQPNAALGAGHGLEQPTQAAGGRIESRHYRYG